MHTEDGNDVASSGDGCVAEHGGGAVFGIAGVSQVLVHGVADRLAQRLDVIEVERLAEDAIADRPGAVYGRADIPIACFENRVGVRAEGVLRGVGLARLGYEGHTGVEVEDVRHLFDDAAHDREPGLAGVNRERGREVRVGVAVAAAGCVAEPGPRRHREQQPEDVQRAGREDVLMAGPPALEQPFGAAAVQHEPGPGARDQLQRLDPVGVGAAGVHLVARAGDITRGEIETGAALQDFESPRAVAGVPAGAVVQLDVHAGGERVAVHRRLDNIRGDIEAVEEGRVPDAVAGYEREAGGGESAGGQPAGVALVVEGDGFSPLVGVEVEQNGLGGVLQALIARVARERLDIKQAPQAAEQLQ